MGQGRIKCVSNCKVDSDFEQVVLKGDESVMHTLRKRRRFSDLKSIPSREICSVLHNSLEDRIRLCSSNLATSNSPIYSIDGQPNPQGERNHSKRTEGVKLATVWSRGPQDWHHAHGQRDGTNTVIYLKKIQFSLVLIV